MVPGRTLHRLATRFLSDATMRRLVEPILADIQKEYLEAISRGDLWRGRLIVLDGYFRFGAALAMYVFQQCFSGSIDQTIDEWHGIRRTFIWSLSIIAAAMAVLVLIPLLSLPLRVPFLFRGLYLLTLLPQALPLAIPIGLPLGIVAGFGQAAVSATARRAVIRSAIVCAVMSFSVMGWLMPYANQTFRTAVFQDAGNHGAPRKGFAELTFGELNRERAFLVQQGDVYQARSAAIAWHQKWSIAGAVVFTAVFALSLVRRFSLSGRMVLLGTVCGALTGYYLVAIGMEHLAQRGYVPPIVAVWAPNCMLLMISVSLQRESAAQS